MNINNYKKYKFQNLKNGNQRYCQITNKKNLIEVIDLGNQPLADSLIEKKNLNKKEKKYPLKLLRSPTLGYAQLSYVVPGEKVYHPNYPYRPGITKEILMHYSDQVKENIKKLNLQKGDLVVDIGSNDGSLLSYYKKFNMNIAGVEPTNIANIANKNKIFTLKKFFNLSSSNHIIKLKGKAKLITSTNVFAHMATLHDVMLGVLNLMDRNSYFIIENHYIKDILEHNQYDSVYHEHIRNYSLKSLIYLFNQYNLKVIDAVVVDRYNGSIKVTATNNLNIKPNPRVNKLLKIEEEFGLFKSKIWNEFKSNIIRSKKELKNMLINLKKQNKKVVGNSCPARCSTLLNYCDIGVDLINYIAEQPSSLKLNKYLPGVKLPIVNNEILFKEQPDFVLILAWHLYKPIIKSLKSKGLKSKFIVPLPQPIII
jgi:hypothetical protein